VPSTLLREKRGRLDTHRHREEGASTSQIMPTIPGRLQKLGERLGKDSPSEDSEGQHLDFEFLAS
jgi:hypothetical protein